MFFVVTEQLVDGMPDEVLFRCPEVMLPVGVALKVFECVKLLFREIERHAMARACSDAPPIALNMGREVVLSGLWTSASPHEIERA